MDSIPNTMNYMIAGYAVLFGGLLIYLSSLYIRRRNLRQDLDMLRELEKSEENREIPKQ